MSEGAKVDPKIHSWNSHLLKVELKVVHVLINVAGGRWKWIEAYEPEKYSHEDHAFARHSKVEYAKTDQDLERVIGPPDQR